MPTERLKLTETACKNAPPNAKPWHTEIRGFGLFTGKAKKTYYDQKDVHGKTTPTKLGTCRSRGRARCSGAIPWPIATTSGA